MIVKKGSPMRCNKCNEKFPAPHDMYRDEFFGQAAARISFEFYTCPHCNQTDIHWVYASDIMPEGLNPEGQKEWKKNN